jgi:hypothetical protein
MWNNVGRTDRAIRIVLGLAVLSLVRIGPETPWGYLGLVPLFTGVFGYCPIYGLMRISTNRLSPSGSVPS